MQLSAANEEETLVENKKDFGVGDRIVPMALFGILATTTATFAPLPASANDSTNEEVVCTCKFQQKQEAIESTAQSPISSSSLKAVNIASAAPGEEKEAGCDNLPEAKTTLVNNIEEDSKDDILSVASAEEETTTIEDSETVTTLSMAQKETNSVEDILVAETSEDMVKESEDAPKLNDQEELVADSTSDTTDREEGNENLLAKDNNVEENVAAPAADREEIVTTKEEAKLVAEIPEGEQESTSTNQNEDLLPGATGDKESAETEQSPTEATIVVKEEIKVASSDVEDDDEQSVKSPSTRSEIVGSTAVVADEEKPPTALNENSSTESSKAKMEEDEFGAPYESGD